MTSATQNPAERAAAADRLIAESQAALQRARRACEGVRNETADKYDRRQWERRARRLEQAARIVAELPGGGE